MQRLLNEGRAHKTKSAIPTDGVRPIYSRHRGKSTRENACFESGGIGFESPFTARRHSVASPWWRLTISNPQRLDPSPPLHFEADPNVFLAETLTSVSIAARHTMAGTAKDGRAKMTGHSSPLRSRGARRGIRDFAPRSIDIVRDFLDY